MIGRGLKIPLVKSHQIQFWSVILALIFTGQEMRKVYQEKKWYSLHTAGFNREQ